MNFLRFIAYLVVYRHSQELSFSSSGLVKDVVVSGKKNENNIKHLSYICLTKMIIDIINEVFSLWTPNPKMQRKAAIFYFISMRMAT